MKRPGLLAALVCTAALALPGCVSIDRGPPRPRIPKIMMKYGPPLKYTHLLEKREGKKEVPLEDLADFYNPIDAVVDDLVERTELDKEKRPKIQLYMIGIQEPVLRKVTNLYFEAAGGESNKHLGRRVGRNMDVKNPDSELRVIFKPFGAEIGYIAKKEGTRWPIAQIRKEFGHLEKGSLTRRIYANLKKAEQAFSQQIPSDKVKGKRFEFCLLTNVVNDPVGVYRWSMEQKIENSGGIGTMAGNTAIINSLGNMTKYITVTDFGVIYTGVANNESGEAEVRDFFDDPDLKHASRYLTRPALLKNLRSCIAKLEKAGYGN